LWYTFQYTTFAYSNLKLSTTKLKKDGTLLAYIRVKNTGIRAGDEVVQLYVRHSKSKVEHPIIELKGFQRVALKPGETKTVQIPVKAGSLAWWNEKEGGWQLEPGPINILIGASSADIRLQTSIDILP